MKILLNGWQNLDNQVKQLYILTLSNNEKHINCKNNLSNLTVSTDFMTKKKNDYEKDSQNKRKIKHETTSKDYRDDGLKNIDISCKIVCLQSSWKRRLYNDHFHEGILLHLITVSFGSKFKFHSNIALRKHDLKNLYRSTKIFFSWKTHFSSSPEIPACLLLQLLWFNTYI